MPHRKAAKHRFNTKTPQWKVEKTQLNALKKKKTSTLSSGKIFWFVKKSKYCKPIAHQYARCYFEHVMAVLTIVSKLILLLSPHCGRLMRRRSVYLEYHISAPGPERRSRVPGRRWTFYTDSVFGAGSGPAQRGCWESADRGGTPVGDPQGDREREERQGEEDPWTGEVRGEGGVLGKYKSELII